MTLRDKEVSIYYSENMLCKNTEKKENCIAEHHQCRDVIHWSNPHTVLLNVDVSDSMLVTSLSTSDTHNVLV